jgi:hypothetical protein
MLYRSLDSKLIGKIDCILKELSGSLFTSERKFLRDLVFGILCSQSAALTHIRSHREVTFFGNHKPLQKGIHSRSSTLGLHPLIKKINPHSMRRNWF